MTNTKENNEETEEITCLAGFHRKPTGKAADSCQGPALWVPVPFSWLVALKQEKQPHVGAGSL